MLTTLRAVAVVALVAKRVVTDRRKQENMLRFIMVFHWSRRSGRVRRIRS